MSHLFIVLPKFNEGVLFCRDNAAIFFLTLIAVYSLILCCRGYKSFFWFLRLIVDSWIGVYLFEHTLTRTANSVFAYISAFTLFWIVVMFNNLVLEGFYKMLIRNLAPSRIIRFNLIASLLVGCSSFYFALSIITVIPDNEIFGLALALGFFGAAFQYTREIRIKHYYSYQDIARRTPSAEQMKSLMIKDLAGRLRRKSDLTKF